VYLIVQGNDRPGHQPRLWAGLEQQLTLASADVREVIQKRLLAEGEEPEVLRLSMIVKKTTLTLY